MADAKTRDLSTRRRSLLVIWVVPMALLFALNFTTDFLSPHAQTGIAVALFAWMGSACTLNAMRCRLHATCEE